MFAQKRTPSYQGPAFLDSIEGSISHRVDPVVALET